MMETQKVSKRAENRDAEGIVEVGGSVRRNGEDTYCSRGLSRGLS